MPRRPKAEELKGVLYFYQDWAPGGDSSWYFYFCDERFVTKNTTQFACTKCGSIASKGPGADSYVISTHKLVGATEPCDPKAHDFQLNPKSYKDYSGLHELKTGDRLTILSVDAASTLWRGTFRISNRSFDKERRLLNPWWPRGFKRKEILALFTNEHPARLIPRRP